MKNSSLFLFISLSFLLFGCFEKDSKVSSDKKFKEVSEVDSLKFYSFLESPLIDDSFLTNKNKFSVNKSGKKTKHYDRFRYFDFSDTDSLFHYKSLDGDEILVFKNYYTQKIVFFQALSNTVKLSNGISLGMPISQFKIPITSDLIRNDSVIKYEDEFFKVKLSFKKQKLDQITYERYIE